MPHTSFVEIRMRVSSCFITFLHALNLLIFVDQLLTKLIDEAALILDSSDNGTDFVLLFTKSDFLEK